MLLTGLLHVAIIYAFMQRQHPADTPRAPREAMQWLLPITQPSGSSLPKPVVKPAPQPTAAAKTPKAITAPKPADIPAAPTPQPETPAMPATPAAIAPDDPFAQTPSASDILNQARLDVRKIDKELRAAYPERAPAPPPDSKQARLERGINAAHEAVPPKWYQAAKIIELSTPDGENKTRTYKIVTGIGTYCIHIRPDGKKSYTGCPK
ncbi:hypothetical protein D0T25_29110 [Duganella sp. BJB488]|nr:hypothetical protein D0T26_29020 [Duganella sp. BJB489]RFP13392.1 hypothetical protein D0T25_29110 [Duganella sp. BJB488]RFP29314.1 hypothetical protein D0T24_29550 [Duganella sp. BJB480]